MHVVVGAGIVGASIAHHLARDGAEVTVLEAEGPAAGATRWSFGWVGAGGGGPDALTPLRTTSLDDLRRLEREVPGVEVRWTGSVRWPVGTTGPGGEEVDAVRVAALEPALVDVPQRALHVSGDGAVDPVAVTRALLDAAQAGGARVRTRTRVTGFLSSGDRVTGVRAVSELLTEDVVADIVVLAAGTGAVPLAASLGVALPVAPSPAVLVRCEAPGGLVRSILDGPDLEVRQVGDDLLAPVGVGSVPSATGLADIAGRTADLVRRGFRGAEGVHAVDAGVGLRPMPVDGLPVLGELPGAPGAYVAVMHSGVTLAAAVGRLVAQELAGRPAPEFVGFRPGRRI